jgi:hypothetical protein
MPKADHDTTTSRRALLAGSTAALLTGAAAATTARAVPLAAPAAADVIPIRPPKIHCVKTGPCPCEEPTGRFVAAFAELTEQWANRAPRRSAIVLPFAPRGEGVA